MLLLLLRASLHVGGTGLLANKLFRRRAASHYIPFIIISRQTLRTIINLIRNDALKGIQSHGFNASCIKSHNLSSTVDAIISHLRSRHQVQV